MAQKQNKKKAPENGIDVINPDTLTREELSQLDEKTTAEKEMLEARLNKVNRQIKGKLWLWWFLPVIGFIIYAMIYQHRLQLEKNQEKTVLLKRQIAEKEIQLMLDKKRWEQLGINSGKN